MQILNAYVIPNTIGSAINNASRYRFHCDLDCNIIRWQSTFALFLFIVTLTNSLPIATFNAETCFHVALQRCNWFSTTLITDTNYAVNIAHTSDIIKVIWLIREGVEHTPKCIGLVSMATRLEIWLSSNENNIYIITLCLIEICKRLQITEGRIERCQNWISNKKQVYLMI